MNLLGGSGGGIQKPQKFLNSRPPFSHLQRLQKERSNLLLQDAISLGRTQQLVKERVVPPSSKPPTDSLRIDRFLRPFTLKAVQELVEKIGSVSSFWMDPIKTHCYVMDSVYAHHPRRLKPKENYWMVLYTKAHVIMDVILASWFYILLV